jgi:phenylacetate-coenzyme A ligase PaaK-like adenylate-forming protein
VPRIDRILMAREYTLGVFQPALEALDPDALARLQLDRMQRTLARVAGNAAWSRRLGGVRPDDVKGPEDWARLPFLTGTSCATAYPSRSPVAAPRAPAACTCRAAPPAIRS